MPYPCLVRLVAFWALFVLIAAAGNSGEQPRPSPEPEYVRKKIVLLQIDVEFKADPERTLPDYPVGDEIVWRKPPLFVLFLGDKPDAPLEKCREIYVEKPVFLSAKIGGKYQQPKRLIKVQPSPRR